MTVTPVKVDTTPHDFTVCFFECLKEGAKQLGFDDLTDAAAAGRGDPVERDDRDQHHRRAQGPADRPAGERGDRRRAVRATPSPAVGSLIAPREHRPAAQGRLRQRGADRDPRAARAGRAPDRREHGRRIQRRQRRAGGPAARRRELPRPLPRRRSARAGQRDLPPPRRPDPHAHGARRARERGEEGFCQHPGWWQEENSDDQLDPALGNVRWNFARRGEIRATSAPVACRFRATSTLGSPTFHSSLLHFSMPGPCKRRCACRS